MSGVTVGDLKDHVGTPGPHPVLHCPVCDATYSANLGDYWDLPKTHVFTCCKTPNELVVKRTVLEPVGYDAEEETSSMNPGIPVGVHRHYKGGRYLVVCVAETHNHNEDRDVVYVVLKTGTHVTRPLRRDSRQQDAWTDDVRWPDGRTRRRFVLEGSLAPATLRTLRDIWEAP